MKVWFDSYLRSNSGYRGVWRVYRPITWQGWFVTLIYVALLAGSVFGTVRAIEAFGRGGIIVMLPMLFFHIAYLWIAQRKDAALASQVHKGQ